MHDKKSIIIIINPIKLLGHLKPELDELGKDNLLLQMISYLESKYDLTFISLGKIAIPYDISTLFIYKYSEFIVSIEK